jgi:hypothetical protein
LVREQSLQVSRRLVQIQRQRVMNCRSHHGHPAAAQSRA